MAEMVHGIDLDACCRRIGCKGLREQFLTALRDLAPLRELAIPFEGADGSRLATTCDDLTNAHG